MKKFKRFLSILCAVCMIFAMAAPASAARDTKPVLAFSSDASPNNFFTFTDEQSDQYDALCNRITLLYAKLNLELESISSHARQNSIQAVRNEIKEVNRQLDEMGSRTLSSEEVSRLAIASNRNQSYGAIDVADTRYAQVRASNLLTTTRNGITYKYCIVTATPTDSRSVLANDTLLYKTNVGAQYVKYLFDFYAMAAIGEVVKWVSWVPFDLFSLENTSVSGIGEYTIDAKVRTTAKYYFVVEAGQEQFLDSSQFLLYETCNIYSRHNLFNNTTNTFYPPQDINYYFTADTGANTALDIAIQNYRMSTFGARRLTDFYISAKNPSTNSVIYTRSVTPAPAPIWIGDIT